MADVALTPSSYDFERRLDDQTIELRDQCHMLQTDKAGRMPLAYLHLVQLLVDSLTALTAPALYPKVRACPHRVRTACAPHACCTQRLRSSPRPCPTACTLCVGRTHAPCLHQAPYSLFITPGGYPLGRSHGSPHHLLPR